MKTAALLLSASLFSGVMLLVCLCWTYTFAALWANRSLPLSRKSLIGDPSNRGAFDIVINILIYGFATVAALEAARSLGLLGGFKGADSASGKIQPIQFYAAGAAQIISILLGTALVCVRAQLSPGKFGWDLTHARNDLILAIYSFGVIIAPVFAIQGLLAQIIDYEHPAITPFKENKSWEFFAAATFAVVLVGPTAEEFFFRGILQAWLQRISILGANSFSEILAPKPIPILGPEALVNSEEVNLLHTQVIAQNQLSPSGSNFDPNPSDERVAIAALPPSETAIPHWPIWVTSAIFALLHSGQGAAPVPLFLFSVMLGYLYRKTDRLLPVIVMHMLLNGLSMAGLALSTLTQSK